ncbi:MAG: hypothetical protein MI740_10615 [Halanaerobiales bacterium]|nr:hypothetical protein [Halanaerobiales bacterium]
MNVDPFELIKIVQPGLMLFGRGKEKLEDQMQTIFLIKEEDKYIKKLKYNPVLQVRFRTFALDNVIAVLIMMKAETDMLYDGWFNYFDISAQEAFLDLKEQDKLFFSFYNNEDKQRTIAINNRLKDSFSEAEEMITKLPCWSMQDFDTVKNQIYSKYPNGQILWNNM